MIRVAGLLSIKALARLIGILIAGLWLSNSWAVVRKDCLPTFADSNRIYPRHTYDPEVIAQALHDVPGMREYALAFLRDPEVPLQVKVIIKRGLQDLQVNVFNLTKEKRERWNVAKHIQAFAHFTPKKYQPLAWVPQDRKTVNEEASDSISNETVGADLVERSGSQDSFFIGVPDHRSYWQRMTTYFESGSFQFLASSDFSSRQLRNSLVFAPKKAYALINLIHELAHCRWQPFFDENRDAIIEKLPYYLGYREGGNDFLNNQFVDLLTERYARESEFKLFRSIRWGPFNLNWDRYSNIENNMTELEIGRAISERLVRDYRYSDPGVIALSPMSLKEIIWNGGGQIGRDHNLIHQTVDSIKGFTHLGPYLLAYGLAAHGLREAKYLITVKDDEIFRNSIREIRSAKNKVNPKETSLAITGTLDRIGAWPGAKEAAVKFLETEDNRSIVRELTGVILPQGRLSRRKIYQALKFPGAEMGSASTDPILPAWP